MTPFPQLSCSRHDGANALDGAQVFIICRLQALAVKGSTLLRSLQSVNTDILIVPFISRMAVVGVIYATDRLKFIRNNSRPSEPRPTDIIIIIEDAPIGK